MNINFELYKTFYVVAKNKNITKASQELLISQPAVSKAIKNLENQLDCTLFIRNRSGVYLTEAGLELYKEVENALFILNNIEDKVKSINDINYGVLSIGTSKTIVEKYLCKYIEKFYKKYPNIKINIITGSDKELIKKVRMGIIDFIIINTPCDIPNDFTITKLQKLTTFFAGTKEYKDIVITYDNIKHLPLILQSTGSTTRYYLEKILNNQNITITPKMEFTSSTLVLEFIKMGLGIGLVIKEYLNDELDKNIIYQLKTNIPLENRYISLITLNDKNLSNIAVKFIEVLK